MSKIGEFFFNEAGENKAGRKRRIKTCIGKITISTKQATRLRSKKGNRLSPQIEKCCLLLVGNESFVNAEKDLEILTGVNVPHSTQHRLVNSYQLPEANDYKKGKIFEYRW